jgi:phosphotriesterase-related protein
MSFVRTVLGDIPPQRLGVCYAHEHIIIDESHATRVEPEFLLDSVEQACAELAEFRASGGDAMIDAMPGGAGRNVEKLAEVSRRTGVHIVCPTGVHLRKYYPDDFELFRLGEEALGQRFAAEIVGEVRAGVIKVAGGTDRLSVWERTAFQAAAMAHRLTGCPILTHTEQGTAALEQVALLKSCGVDLSRVTLSHTDRAPDAAYHRDILATGVNVEYDSAFRWDTAENPTLRLLVELCGEFPHQIMLGMDAARRRYWRSYGGSPGLAYLLVEFRDMMKAAGLASDVFHRIFIDTPARAFSFARDTEDQP